MARSATKPGESHGDGTWFNSNVSEYAGWQWKGDTSSDEGALRVNVEFFCCRGRKRICGRKEVIKFLTLAVFPLSLFSLFLSLSLYLFLTLARVFMPFVIFQNSLISSMPNLSRWLDEPFVPHSIQV